MTVASLEMSDEPKIACAEKLFDQLSSSQIKYGKVDGFDELMSIVNAE